jgi:RTA1 like protein
LRAALTTLYISSTLIGIRTLYRTIEYFSSSSLNFSAPNLDPSTFSPVLRYEWFFWIFEATLMMINSVLLNARHPMRYLPRDNKVYLAEDGRTEVLGRGYEDQRSWWVTFLDPFGLWGMLRGRQSLGMRFWETHEEGRTQVAGSGQNVEGEGGGVGEAEKGKSGWRFGFKRGT